MYKATHCDWMSHGSAPVACVPNCKVWRNSHLILEFWCLIEFIWLSRGATGPGFTCYLQIMAAVEHSCSREHSQSKQPGPSGLPTHCFFLVSTLSTQYTSVLYFNKDAVMCNSGVVLKAKPHQITWGEMCVCCPQTWITHTSSDILTFFNQKSPPGWVFRLCS